MENSTDTNLLFGIRGGIIINLTTVFDSPSENNDESTQWGSTSALTLANNVVIAPRGSAVGAVVMGSASITNNQFRSNGNSIVDFQKVIEFFISKYKEDDLNENILPLLLSILNLGNSGPIRTPSSVNDGQLSSKVPERTPRSSSLPFLPSGNILYNDNQIISGINKPSPYSQIIISMDDLGYGNNQSECLDDTLLNTFLFGRTARAYNNRFKESKTWTKETRLGFSLIDVGLVSVSASNNQADNCIIPLTSSPLNVHSFVYDNNQIINPNSLCRYLGPIFQAIQSIPVVPSLDEPSKGRLSTNRVFVRGVMQ